MNTDRKKQILEILLKEKEINVKDLAKRLYISEPSIRRDLALAHVPISQSSPVGLRL